MSRYQVEYSVSYGGSTSHRTVVLTMDYPSESMAVDILRRQGTIKAGDNVVVKSIKPA